MSKKIDYLKLDLSPNLIDKSIEKFRAILQKGNYILGEECEKFEENISGRFECKYALGVGSGFDALFLALYALGIGEGDEVVTVANSFVATVAAANLLKAKVVYCDVGEDRNMSVEDLKRVVSEKTKAIIVVHLAGIPAKVDEIVDYAKEKGIFVLEDGSQAFGATINNKYVGTFGDIGCFSMHPTKNLGAMGDAGFITTDDRELYDRIRRLRNHGLVDRDHCVEFGYNSRLDELQAALLNLKISEVDSWNERRNEIADKYRNGLKDLPVKLPFTWENTYNVYFSFVIMVEDRERLMDYLSSKSIECKIHYPISIHKQQASIDSIGEVSLPKTEAQNERILSLPIYPSLKDEQIEYIIDSITEYYSKL